jgi:hypothetical protein
MSTRGGRSRKGGHGQNNMPKSLSAPLQSENTGRSSNSQETTTREVTPNSSASMEVVGTNVPPMVSTGLLPTSQTDEPSVLTANTPRLPTSNLSRETIMKFTQRYLFPKIKFLSKVSEEPSLQWSDDERSLCQFVLKGCNIRSENNKEITLEKAWLTVRKYVAEKITNIRNDKSSSVRRAFYGKFDPHWLYKCFYLTINVCNRLPRSPLCRRQESPTQDEHFPSP